PGVVLVIAVGAAAVIVAVGVQQEKGRMRGVVTAGCSHAVVHLLQHVGILQRAEPAASVFVPDVALGRNRDEFVRPAVRVFRSAGVVLVIAVGAAAVIVAVGVQQEKGRMRGVVTAGCSHAVVHLLQHVGILQRAEPAASVFVPDVALGRNRDEFVRPAVRVF